MIARDAAEAIKKRAHLLGFEAFGIARPDSASIREARAGLKSFLAKDHHGEMRWMENRARLSPREIMPSVKSVLLLGINYAPLKNPMPDLLRKEKGVFSVYVSGEDYHRALGRKLKALARFVKRRYRAETRPFADTAPVMEKPYAEAAGLGWQGKHTNLVARDFGSWLFLGGILTDMALPPSRRHQNRCGTCRACLDVCPTGAFPAPFQLDARRCISYLTIEYDGVIPKEFREAIGNRVYGCDDCLAVCPWNKFAKRAHDAAFHSALPEERRNLASLLALDEEGFRRLFARSAVKRIGWARLLRNLLIAAANSGETSLIPLIKPHLSSLDAPVRASAIWALKRLLSPSEFDETRSRHLPREKNPAILAEWNGASEP